MSETDSARRARLRRAARLAAVQALYQMEVAGQGASAVVKQFRDHRFGHDHEPGDYIEADEDFFEDLVAGIIAAQSKVDRTLSATLKEGWKFSRIDATVRAILRAGGYELSERSDVPTAVVIDEYVDIAKAFFDGPEPGFVNGALDSFAKTARPAAIG